MKHSKPKDASKINRIVERFKLATVDTATIKNEIVKDKAAKEAQKTECQDKQATIQIKETKSQREVIFYEQF